MQTPSLMDNEARGGDTAEGGFKFQIHHTVARIPCWLAQDGFQEMIREALGDAEARFFIPGRQGECEFIEYKDHMLIPSKFWPEIQRFQDMENGAPGTYRKFVLVCVGLSKKLHPLKNALKRVRQAFPFYDGAELIQEASYQDYAQAVSQLGQDAETAKFIFDKVLLEDNVPDAGDLPFELFRSALIKNYPQLDQEEGRKIRMAYLELIDLIGSRKNRPVLRQEIESVLWNNIEVSYHPRSCIRLHTLAHQDEIDQGPITFDWGELSGGKDRSFPPQEQWMAAIEELWSARDWILSTQRPKRLVLTGNRRLSASVAIGAIFSAVEGFSIDLHYREDIWPTDQFPTQQTPSYVWSTNQIDGTDKSELVITIGVKRDPSYEVTNFLPKSFPSLHLFSDEAILSPDHANSAVDKAKRCIDKALITVKPEKLHLFLATPAFFSLFLGHRLNATCDIQCYERVSVGQYIPTMRLNMT